MKKFTKTLSIVLLVAMCVSMFTISSFAGTPGQTCGVDGCTGTVSSVATSAKPATCIERGYVEHYKCDMCTACFDSNGNHLSASEFYTDADVSNSNAHSWTDVAATAGDCQTPGTVAHSVCSGCGKYLVDHVVVDSLPSGTIGSHQLGTRVNAKEATCGTAGNIAYYKCALCGAAVNNAGEALGDITVPATGNHSYDAAGDCVGCGATNPNHKFQITGDNPAEFSATGVYTYTVDANHTVTGVSADGYSLYNGNGFYYANGKVTVQGSAIASLIGSKSSIELVFTASDGCTVGGITLNNQTTVDTLKVDGFAQKGFIQGSTEAVSFVTNDSNPNNVKLYSTETQTFVTIGSGDYSMSKVGSNYTYTFNKSFLDTLDTGTYYVRCYYGTNSYVTAGTLYINLSEATAGDTSLYFTNSTISTTEFKYVSGGESPRLYSQMFLLTNNLQMSTNGGTSWSKVSVYDFYIEQSNGDDTPYAWFKTSFLDSLPAASNVYFRIVATASTLSDTTDAVSNWIKITTGNTLTYVDTNKHVINSSKNLRFVCSDVIEEVYVGGQNLAETDPDAFSISKDGKYVTLYADFLNARTAGSTYTLTVLTESGEKLSTTFQILTTAQASSSPKTGDDSNIALWSAFLLMSGAAVVAVLPRLKKEN